jgi:hypothetical protein
MGFVWFVFLLKEEKILLNKSQVPTVKVKQQSIRIKFSPDQIKKKIT